MIRGEDYSFLVEFMAKQCGMELGLDKSYLIRSRLEPLVQKYNLKDLTALVDHLRADNHKELREEVVDCMLTKESLFFRDGPVYQSLQDSVLPALFEARKVMKAIRVWSAACSTGQEPYSIAMMLSQYPKDLRDWHMNILATDISRTALERSMAGVYSSFEVQRGISEVMLKRFFIPQDANWKVNPEVARKITFGQQNLIQPFQNKGPFDIIFCRYVLIYFDFETKKKILNEISKCLAPDGYLVLGASENVLGIDQFVKTEDIKVSIYRKKGN